MVFFLLWSQSADKLTKNETKKIFNVLVIDVYDNGCLRPVFFNLGSSEPLGSDKIFLGSATFLAISSFMIFEHTKLLKIEQKRVC
jgi:hypothetical protein